MRQIVTYLVLVLGCGCLGCLGCCRVTPTPTPSADSSSWDASDPDTDVDSDLDAVRQDDCARACAVMRSLHCPEADPVDTGDSCEVVCRHVKTSGLTDLKPRCVAAAKTIDEVRACGTVKCKR